MSVYFESKTDTGKVQVRDDTYISWLYSKTKLSQYYKGTRYAYYHFSDGTKFTKLVSDYSSYMHTPITPTLSKYQIHLYELPEDALCFVSNPHGGLAVHLFFTLYDLTEQTGPHYYDFRHIGNKKYLGVANCTKEQADNLDVYIYSQGENPYNNSYGLECYNASGKKVFDSNRPPIKLLSGFTFEHIAYTNAYNLNDSYNLDNYVAVNRSFDTVNKIIALLISTDGMAGQHVNMQQCNYDGQSLYGGPALQTVAILRKNGVQFRTRDFHLFDYLNDSDVNVKTILSHLLDIKVCYNVTMASIIDVAKQQT